MIRSVAHLPTRAWLLRHKARRRHMFLIMSGVIGAIFLLWFVGAFGGVDWPSLLQAVWLTTSRLILAYIAALVVGVSIALIVGWSPFFDVLFPFFDVLQSIPSFALLPIFIYLFGYSDEMIILFAMSSIIWPILFAVLTSIKSAHADIADAAAIFGARGLRKILFYLAPLSYPSILTGSIVGIAIGWEAVIGAEIITSIAGFGDFIRDESTMGVSQGMIAGTFAILVIVFTLNRLVWSPLLSESARRYAE